MNDSTTPPLSNTTAKIVPNVGLTPIKQERPFSSGSSQGNTVWYHTALPCNLAEPPAITTRHGDLYINENTTNKTWQVWLYGQNNAWELVQANECRVLHPTIPDWVLSLRANGEPSWITLSSSMTIKARKEKGKEREV